MTLAGNTPIIIGVGQVMRRWRDEDPSHAPSPQHLMMRAVEAALVDSGEADDVRAMADVLAVTRLFADSLPGDNHPFGKCQSLPCTVARMTRMAPDRSIYSHVGGNVPQALINEFAAELYAGTARMVVLAGAEAIAAVKHAKRNGIDLDWSDYSPGNCEDRGMGDMLLDSYELANGLGAPPLTYPFFEHALRHRWGLDRAAHMQAMSQMFARLADTARDHAQAQFEQCYDAQFLATPSQDNYPVSDPYLKWHVAQDAVNQGAAVIMTTVAEAQRIGVKRDKWVFLHGSGEASDALVSERPDLSRSVAMEAALAGALQDAGVDAAQLRYLDLYSCFPCAVFLAAEALGLDWHKDPLSVTGGLPFFGGAGNNYSMHAIATMVDRLRDEPEDFGLVLANGGFLSKEAVGIYSAREPVHWAPRDHGADQAKVAAQNMCPRQSKSGDFVIESYTVGFHKGNAQRASIMMRDGENRIVAATARDPALNGPVLAALTDQQRDPIGRQATIVSEDGRNVITAII